MRCPHATISPSLTSYLGLYLCAAETESWFLELSALWVDLSFWKVRILLVPASPAPHTPSHVLRPFRKVLAGWSPPFLVMKGVESEPSAQVPVRLVPFPSCVIVDWLLNPLMTAIHPALVGCSFP